MKIANEAETARAQSPPNRRPLLTGLYRMTGDLYLVQPALGHRQITTTEIYARVGEELFLGPPRTRASYPITAYHRSPGRTAELT